MTTRYRAHRDSILAEDQREKNILPICETYDRAVFDRMLAEADCQQVRIYYGMDEDLKIHSIIVGADSKGADILPAESKAALRGDDDEPVIIESANRCPDLCPEESPLNS